MQKKFEKWRTYDFFKDILGKSKVKTYPPHPNKKVVRCTKCKLKFNGKKWWQVKWGVYCEKCIATLKVK
jgi:hypothetical protein